MHELISNKKAQFVFKRILDLMADWIKNKRTGKLNVELNFSEGGIGDCKVKKEEKL